MLFVPVASLYMTNRIPDPFMQNVKARHEVRVEARDFGFRREVAENSALQGCYAASNSYFLPTFWNSLSVQSSGFKNFFDSPALRMEPIGCPETSARNSHYWLRNSAEERSTSRRKPDVTQFDKTS
jgi:hypothetical protein